jgi:hypothetical protein
MRIKAVIFRIILLIAFFEEIIAAQSGKNKYLSNQFLQSTLSAKLHLSKQQFKLCQGVQTIGDNSYWLWSVFNSTAIQDSGYWYNSSQHNNLSSSYKLLLYHAIVRANADSCSLNNAILKYADAQDYYAWNKTYDNLISELKAGKPMTITADTSFVERNATETFNERIVIKTTFDHLAIFSSYPLSQTDTLNSELKSYKPWFTPCFLAEAYENIDNRMLSPEDWECAFNSSGYLTGITIALIVVDKGTIAITVSCNTVETTTLTQITSPIMLGVLVSGIKEYMR